MNEHPMSVLKRANQLIKPVTDNAKVDAMLRILVDLSPQEQSDMWFRESREAGSFCLFQHANFPGFVVEYVAGTQQDSVTTLYQTSSAFATRSGLAELRRELMREIAAATLSIPSAIGIHDHGREREVRLAELGTAQLVDTLARALSVSLSAI